MWKAMVRLAAAGWVPISSGNGLSLYWKKDGSYNYPGGAYFGQEAVKMCESPAFWRDVEEAKLAL